MKRPPTYAVTSVDHALRLAVILQMEGAITVSVAAERLGVARSTAHRLLQTLVYRDFAVQTEDRTYRAGPVLEMSSRSASDVSRLRSAALEPIRGLVESIDETVNLSVRTATTVRFVASVECNQVLRVGSREGMVFPAHLVTGGLVMLAALSTAQVRSLYAEERFDGRSGDRPNMAKLDSDLRSVRRSGYALNIERSERGLVAVGVAVRNSDSDTVGASSISMPSVRYRRERVAELVAAPCATADLISDAL